MAIANWQISNKIAPYNWHFLAYFCGNWCFNPKIYNKNINEALLKHYVFVVFMSYGKVEIYHIIVYYTVFFIIKSNIAAET